MNCLEAWILRSKEASGPGVRHSRLGFMCVKLKTLGTRDRSPRTQVSNSESVLTEMRGSHAPSASLAASAASCAATRGRHCVKTQGGGEEGRGGERRDVAGRGRADKEGGTESSSEPAEHHDRICRCCPEYVKGVKTGLTPSPISQ